MSDPELDDLRDQIDEVSYKALLLFDDETFLDKVEEELGVAVRHSQLLAAGELTFTDGIAREMRTSIERAMALVSASANEELQDDDRIR
jgi:hypothetical protein